MGRRYEWGIGWWRIWCASQISFQDYDLMCCSSSSSTPPLMERIEGFGIWGYWSRTQLASNTGYIFHTESIFFMGPGLTD